MRWIEAKVTFSGENNAVLTELISDLFYSQRVSGVVVDDPDLEPVEGWGSDAVPRPTTPAVTGYFPDDDRLETNRRTLMRALADLSAREGFHYTVSWHTIDEEDWAESWKEFFWPERITPRLTVKPTWRQYDPQPDEIVIDLDPGMAFGTGTHPTTALCLRLIEKHLRTGYKVLDVGTGSGILLIAADKLGAGRLTGVDLDPVAVAVARENLLRNHIAKHRFDLKCGDMASQVTGQYDLVVANILADVIIELMIDIPRVLRPGGIFICSGIIETRRSVVEKKMGDCGFEFKECLNHQEWVAMVGGLINPLGDEECQC